MASAVLARGNETSWMQSGGRGGGGSGSGVMRKISYLNPNPNPISNPKKKKKVFHPTSNGGRQRKVVDFPTITPVQNPVEINQSNGFNSGGYLTYNMSTYSKTELLELRGKFVSELLQIQSLRDRIESGNLISSLHNNQWKSWTLGENRSAGPVRSSNDISHRFPNVFENRGNDNVGCFMDETMMKECRQILTKLLKQKASWYFKAPVDAAALNLHDYHLIIKRPMDLGTVKSNLSKNLYPSPMDFAADVRLTLNNAMLYNPKTDEAHRFAEMLLGKFEELFRPIQEKIDLYTRQRIEMYSSEYLGGDGGFVEEVQGSSWNHIPTPDRIGKQKMSPNYGKQDRMHSQSSASTPPITPHHTVMPKAQSPLPIVSPVRSSPLPIVSPVRSSPVKQQQAVSQVVGRGKLPKPKAKDPNKRDMIMEEKHKLGEGLQSLPQEKMPQLVQIIRKRNEQLAEDGDEIELDIQTLDTETLWELDRFVTNWKKTASKTKRQALMVNSSNPAHTSAAEVDEEAVDEKSSDFVKKPKPGDVGDEDIDIDDDDTSITSFPPVEIERDEAAGQNNGNGNDDASSSSSGSSSSSSSGSSSSSDSDSSSGSDSDADEAQS